jgi:aspartyl/asparaginyl beta-hydroxylase (cupin superfamily)
MDKITVVSLSRRPSHCHAPHHPQPRTQRNTMAPPQYKRRQIVSHSVALTAVALASLTRASAFSPLVHERTHVNNNITPDVPSSTLLHASSKSKGEGSGGGFGGGFGASSSKKKASPSRGKSGRADLLSTLNDEDSKKKESKSFSRTFVKSDQEQLLNDLAAKSANTIIGRAVARSPQYNTPKMDPFWQMLPSLIATKFPTATDEGLKRVAGMVEHSLGVGKLDDDVVQDPWRPHLELHAYMPGLGETQPFLDPNQLELCKQLSENYDVIAKEYEVLLENRFDRKGKDRFQSVTSMNYDAGWKTMVLFYNGHRIKDFPYKLCPVTTRILESVPLAGRIAGFNRQQPDSGIPVHSDGNNMWLTTQMGIKVPPSVTNDKGETVPSAHIRVGPETRHWEQGQCLLYDTTYEHETYNKHPTEERVVLHVDFFNTLKMTKLEIEVLQYIYDMREQFMKAEGVAKVGAQVL